MKPLQQLTLFSLLFAFMIVLHILENTFFFIPVGGYPLKIGISNLVAVVVLFHFSSSAAIGLVVLKVLALALFEPRSTAFSAIISASGSFLSLAAMILVKKLFKKNVCLTSTIGGIMHNAGQWMAVWLITQIQYLWYFLPMLVLSGALAGLLVGGISQQMNQKLSLFKNNHRY